MAGGRISIVKFARLSSPVTLWRTSGRAPRILRKKDTSARWQRGPWTFTSARSMRRC